MTNPNVNTDNLHLVYIRRVGENFSGRYEYELFFSETPENVWGEDWNVACPSACGELAPDEGTYSTVRRVQTDVWINTVQENSCFSMQDCIDQIVALAWTDNASLILQFGESFSSTADKLMKVGIVLDIAQPYAEKRNDVAESDEISDDKTDDTDDDEFEW